MKIWIDMQMTSYDHFVDKSTECDEDDDDDRDCGDGRGETVANDVLDCSIFSLCQAIPLRIQQCAPELWSVCNPTGSGHIAVLDAPALAFLRQFPRLDDANESPPPVFSDISEDVLEVATLLYRAGLLRKRFSLPTLTDPQEIKTVTAWLHVTNACNLHCQYCYLDKNQEHMSEDTALRAVDAVFRSALRRHCERVHLKYAGGEASLHMSHVIAVHDYALQQAEKYHIALRGTLLSNGVMLSQPMIDRLKARSIGVTISLDGLGHYHDSQRPFIHGQSTFIYVDRTIKRLLANKLIPHISVTVTQKNLAGLPELCMYLLEHQLPFTLSYYRDNEYAQDKSSLQFNEDAMISAMRTAFAVIEEHLPQRSLLGSLIDKANLHYAHQRTCGVGQNYLVIDQHGGVAKCQAHIKQTITTIAAADPLQQIRDDKMGIQNVSVDEKEGCRTCDWRHWCAGGCPLLTYRMTGRYDIKSPNCHIYQALFPDVVRLEALRLLKYVTPFAF